MRPTRRRWTMLRLARLETFEPRIVPSSTTLNATLDATLNDEVEATAIDATSDAELAEILAAYGLTGSGQTVAVIDSGIAYDHIALGGGYGSSYRVVGGYDFVENDANPYDDGPSGGHGTHVAGIIAADGDEYSGVATAVDLVSLRVFDDSGDGSMTDIEAALRWVHENRNAFANPITTVNLSLGTSTNTLSASAAAILEDELAQLEADGIFIAVAAGNHFNTYKVAGLSYPASSSYVVAVSSVDSNGMLSSFSQRATWAICAPGRSITSTVPDYLGNHNGVADDYAAYSGTSMAAPYVAGAAVLLREAFNSVGITNVNQDLIYEQMVNTADTIHDSATGDNYLRLNLANALEAVLLHGAGNAEVNTLGLYSAASGSFYLRDSNTTGTATTTFTYGSAKSSYTALVGDWDGDGVDTVGLYNPATSTFYLRNRNNAGSSDLKFSFGPAGAGWTPIVGDWNGDGIDTVGLYNAQTSTFYLRNSNGTGTYDVELTFGLAGAGWAPIVGDWNGDGVETVGLYNSTTSTFYLKNSHADGCADVSFAYGAAGAGWTAIAGDFNGDGIDTVGLYAPHESVFYLRNTNTTGYADRTVAFGAAGAGWQPLAGTWDADTHIASMNANGEQLGSLALSQFAFSGVDLADAVSHVLAGMSRSSEAATVFASPVEQRLVDAQGSAITMGIDPHLVDHVDLENVAPQGTASLDDTDLTALSHAADSLGISDIVFSEDGPLGVLG
jgi:subtilisin family serine protease